MLKAAQRTSYHQVSCNLPTVEEMSFNSLFSLKDLQLHHQEEN